jgi:hypothetical protein
MKKKIMTLLIAALFGGFFAAALPTTVAYAAQPGEVLVAVDPDPNAGNSGNNGNSGIENAREGWRKIGGEQNDTNIYDTIKNILGAVFIVVGIIAVIVLVIGGINYMMSQGDPGKVKKAKDTILYGIIGLIVSLLAFAIVQFVLDALA